MFCMQMFWDDGRAEQQRVEQCATCQWEGKDRQRWGGNTQIELDNAENIIIGHSI